MNQLVHLLRRLVNVISTLSLTNQYFVHTPRLQLNIWSAFNSLSLDLGWLLYSRSTENVSAHEHASASNTRLALDTTSSQVQPAHPSDEHPLSHFPQGDTERQDTVRRLMNNPALFDHSRAPRYPIVLCHGLYGFDVRGPAAFPSLRLHYWSNVLSVLKHKLGAEGSIASRAECLDRVLQQRARGRGINLMAHSMGGLDCRHLITHLRPTEYMPLSLTSISTPHRGSPFMDWCAHHLGLGRRQHERTHQRGNDGEQQTRPEPALISSTNPNGASEKRDTAFRLSLATLPSSFTTLLLSLLDSPAYANLTTSYLNDVFNPSTPNDPRVKYFSVASRIDEMNIWHPLWFPKMVLDDAERKARERLKAAVRNTSHSASIPPWEQEHEWGNDGLVTVRSARWGEFLGVLDGCDHWDIRGARRMEMNVELPTGLGNMTNRVTGEGWSFGDWPRFIGAWRKQEKGASQGLELVQTTDIGSSDTEETEQNTTSSRNDPVIKASTDKLSAVFDWIVEHVPTSGTTSPQKEKFPPKETTKFDLERFYVALTRKLYDEGL
ncbi:alpha beta-hydrolase [Boletus edulis]|nr:alpha beta-hydrolase [Boletus edulis]